MFKGTFSFSQHSFPYTTIQTSTQQPATTLSPNDTVTSPPDMSMEEAALHWLPALDTKANLCKTWPAWHLLNRGSNATRLGEHSGITWGGQTRLLLSWTPPSFPSAQQGRKTAVPFAFVTPPTPQLTSLKFFSRAADMTQCSCTTEAGRAGARMIGQRHLMVKLVKWKYFCSPVRALA